MSGVFVYGYWQRAYQTRWYWQWFTMVSV